MRVTTEQLRRARWEQANEAYDVGSDFRQLGPDEIHRYMLILDPVIDGEDVATRLRDELWGADGVLAYEICRAW